MSRAVIVDSWALRGREMLTPSGPEGSSGSVRLWVTQISPAINNNRFFIDFKGKAQCPI